MKCTGNFLKPPETDYLLKWMTTNVLDNIVHLSKAGVLYGQSNMRRSPRAHCPPPESLFTGLQPQPTRACVEANPFVRPGVATVLKGSFTAMIDGRVYMAQQGDWLIFPRSAPHREFCLPSHNVYQLLWFHQSQPYEMGESRYSANRGFEFRTYIPARRPPIEVQETMDSILSDPAQPVDSLRCHLARLAGWWLGVIRDCGSEEEGARNLLIERIRQAIEQIELSGLSVAKVAETLGVSRSHVSRVFHRATGQTLCHFIQRRRVEEAKHRLCDPAPSVKEVAYAVGFSNPQHMARAFRELEGVTPLAWRRDALASFPREGCHSAG